MDHTKIYTAKEAAHILRMNRNTLYPILLRNRNSEGLTRRGTNGNWSITETGLKRLAEGVYQ